MVSTNRRTDVDVITGRARIPAESLSPQDWLDIINAVISEIYPSLKYFSGLNPIKELHSTKRFYKKDSARVFFPKGISEETRHLYIINLAHDVDKQQRRTHTEILLTKSADWILWKYVSKQFFTVRSDGRTKDFHDELISSKFGFLNKNSLLEILQKNPIAVGWWGRPLGGAILNRLKEITETNLKDRQLRLNWAQNHANKITEIERHIEYP